MKTISTEHQSAPPPQRLDTIFEFIFHFLLSLNVSVYSSKQSPPFPLGTDRAFLTRISIHLSHSNCSQLCFFTVEIEKLRIVGIFSPDFKIYIFFADLVTFQTRVKTSPMLVLFFQTFNSNIAVVLSYYKCLFVIDMIRYDKNIKLFISRAATTGFL